MKRRLDITVDLFIEDYCPIKLKQMDSTELVFKILSNTLEIEVDNLIGEIVFTKPDDTVVIQECIKENNRIIVPLLPSCLRMAGKAKIEVSLKQNEEIISTFQIPIIIEKTNKNNIRSDNTPNYIEILEEAADSERERKEQENLRQEAEENRRLTEEERNEAELTRQNNETTRTNAEEARVANENVRETEEINRNSNETTRQNNETARINAENARVEEFNRLIEQIQLEHIFIYHPSESIQSNVDITLPCYYKVGFNVLTVFCDGSYLSKSQGDYVGNYKEVGEVGSISNKIQLQGSWGIDQTDELVIIVRGEWSNE